MNFKNYPIDKITNIHWEGNLLFENYWSEYISFEIYYYYYLLFDTKGIKQSFRLETGDTTVSFKSVINQ